MQVNHLDSLPNMTVDVSTTKASENADPGFAGSFSAQMGQIIRRESKENQKQSEDASVEQKQAQTSNDSLNALSGLSFLSTVAAATAPVPIIDGTVSQGLPNSDSTMAAVLTGASEISGENSSITQTSLQTEMRPSLQMPSSANSVEASAESQYALGTSSSTFPGNANTLISEAENYKTASQWQLNSEANSKKSLDSGGSQSEALKTEPGDIEDPLLSKAKVLDQMEAMPTAKPERTSVGDPHAVKDDISKRAPLPKDIQNKPDGVPANPEFGQTALHSIRNGSGLRSEVFPVRGESGFIDNGQTMRISNAASENAQAGAARKLENAAMAAMESANTGDSNSDQDAHQNGTAAWTILQNRLESSQQNSGFSRAAVKDIQQDVFSQVLSNHARVSELSSLKMQGDVQPAAAQNKDFLFLLAERIQFQVREGSGQLRIQLKPDSLGRLEINAETAGAGVVARITTESSSVKTYLENNLHVLQQALQDNGLKVERIHIVVQEAFDPHSSSGNTTQFGHAGSEQNEEKPGSLPGTGSKGSSTANPLEEMAIDPMAWIALNPNVRFHTVA
jgi:flagellar hook-length control protein FliK